MPNLTDEELRTIDEVWLQSQPELVVRSVLLRVLEDLKEARACLNQFAVPGSYLTRSSPPHQTRGACTDAASSESESLPSSSTSTEARGDSTRVRGDNLNASRGLGAARTESNPLSPAISPNLSLFSSSVAGDIKSLSVRGGLAAFAGQGVKFILNLGSTMALARLLSPQDFGVTAMVTAVTGFIMVFNDLGLSMATVQQTEINHGQVSTLFWINVALGALLMLITITLAPAVAWFYDERSLIAVTAALSITFLLAGLTVQHQALLRRQMRLKAVATIDVAAMAVGSLTAIYCASHAMGYWALVMMQIATATVTTAGVWIAADWIPALPRRRTGVRSMLAFGGYLMGFSTVNYFARNFDNVLIGRFCGAQALGLYSRAYSLLLFPIGQITAPMTAVAVPALSRLKGEPERYRNYYLKAIRVIAYLSFPLVTALAVLAPEVIVLILGAQWLDAAPIFRVLAITAMFQPIVGTVGWLYISLGQSRRMAKWGVVACTLLVVSFVIGLPWGPIGVAFSYATCALLLIHPQFIVATRYSPLKPCDIYKAIYRPFLLSVLVGVGIWCPRSLGEYISVEHIVPVSIGLGCLLTAISFLLWSGVRNDMQIVIAMFGALRGKS